MVNDVHQQRLTKAADYLISSFQKDDGRGCSLNEIITNPKKYGKSEFSTDELQEAIIFLFKLGMAQPKG